MFKIDWPCAIGGALVGYYAKGRVEATKAVVKKISTDAMASIKESFQAPEEQAASDWAKHMDQQIQAQAGQNGKGKNG